MFFNMVKLEATYFLSFLSLISQSDCEFQAGLWNLQNISTEEIKYFLTRRQFDFNEVGESFQRLRGLGDDERRRFINACNRYRQAISIFQKEPVVSFFLLVVAIECLSNSMVIQASDIDWDAYTRFFGPTFNERIRNVVRFVEFICKYLPADVLANEGDLSLLKIRLLSAYFIRNSFVHDGEDLPRPVRLADFVGRRSFAYVLTRGSQQIEIRAPGLLWLGRIVVNALKGYLTKESGDDQHKAVFREQARQAGLLEIKLRQPHPPIEKGQAITVDFAKKFFEGDD
jgi:hypothetical protein